MTFPKGKAHVFQPSFFRRICWLNFGGVVCMNDYCLICLYSPLTLAHVHLAAIQPWKCVIQIHFFQRLLIATRPRGIGHMRQLQNCWHSSGYQFYKKNLVPCRKITFIAEVWIILQKNPRDRRKIPRWVMFFFHVIGIIENIYKYLLRYDKLLRSVGPVLLDYFGEVHPGRLTAWFTYSHHPFRKENDRNQTYMIMLHYVPC